MEQEHFDGNGHKLSEKKQTILIFLCWLMYVASYIGRYSYNANITRIMNAFSIENYSETGLVTTFFFFAYGVGQVVNGLLCKKYNKQYVLFGAMLISALINLAVFLGIDFSIYKYLWLLNGASLSILWCSLILCLSENLETKRLKGAILIMGTTVASGTFLAYGAAALFSLFDFWEASFLFSSIVLLVVGILWVCIYKKVTLPKGEYVTQTKTETVQNDDGKRMSKTMLWAMLAALAVFSIVCNLIKDGLMTWVPSILKKQYGFEDSLSIVLTLSLPVVGILGVFLVSQLKKRTNNFVLIAGILYVLTLLGLGGVLGSFSLTTFIPLVVCFSLVYCFMTGMNNAVTAMAPLYLRREINSGVLAGVLDGFCYVGSTISSYGLGAIADNMGWKSVFILLTICAAVAVILATVFCIIEKRREGKGEIK